MPIDPASHVPIYDQIVQHLRGAVAAGVHRPGEMLPSIRTLALDLGVNPNTVQRAFQELERVGLVVPVRGRGMAVAARGAQTAQHHAAAVVRDTLATAAKSAREANLPAAQVRELFGEALTAALKTRNRTEVRTW